MRVSFAGDWPTDRESEQDRLKNAIVQLCTMDDYAIFNGAVSLDDYPLYSQIIAYPIDLGTILERLENHFYRLRVE